MYQYHNNEFAGLPYDDITWYDVIGQPFGIASYFNSIILGDASNIVDTKGAMAVGGNFTSSRGLSLGYGNNGKLDGTGYSPDFVRFLVGGNIAMQGPLVVIGHVVGGNDFRAARGSTYMIGKDGSPDQAQTLSDLYHADNGSKYWGLSDRGTHYAVSSYDVPRYIPASRINADVNGFFADARESFMNYLNCFSNLQPNGTTTVQYQTLILRGNDPKQNVFLVDASPNGVLDKEIRLDIPRGSLAIVKLRTGNHAYIRAGLLGNEAMATHTIYVFEDAQHIHMETPAAIWGSIFAPQAIFHANPSGGTVSGNAALGSLEVNNTSGFEFHLYPFVGGLVCRMPEVAQPAPEMTQPEYVEDIMPEQEEMPAPVTEVSPAQEEAPVPVTTTPMPTTPMPTTPMPTTPMPTTPMPTTTPMPATTPAPITMPAPIPMPVPMPMPTPRPRPIPRPMPRPIPVPMPIPAPIPRECPECPEQQPCPPCPTKVEPIPIPIPIPVPEKTKCEECLIQPGSIFGCIWGCSCGRNHEWVLELYKSCGDKRILINCIKVCDCGCFRFDVPYDDFYLLVIKPMPVRNSCHRRHRNRMVCKPMVTLKNVGVANLMIE